MKAIEYSKKLSSFLVEYNYLPLLTKKLDSINDKKINQNFINEIVLWKVNRYVEVPEPIFSELEKIKKLKGGQHKNAEVLLNNLLEIRGIDLPMASTILRFTNSNVFQIIDKHAYRAIFGRPYSLYTYSNKIKKIDVYFEYIDELIKLCKLRKLEFKTIDRLLYIFDKEVNGSLS
jgi:thermostable 8-oxoguanine DNA glycosylase